MYIDKTKYGILLLSRDDVANMRTNKLLGINKAVLTIAELHMHSIYWLEEELESYMIPGVFWKLYLNNYKTSEGVISVTHSDVVAEIILIYSSIEDRKTKVLMSIEGFNKLKHKSLTMFSP